MKLLLSILCGITLLSSVIAGDGAALTNKPPAGDPTPFVPIHKSIPPIPAIPPNTTPSIRYVMVTNFVYQCEYQTNAANAVITEFRTVNATNYVPRYPKLLYIQPMFSETAGGDPTPLGKELVFKIGDATNGFYSAELRIE